MQRILNEYKWIVENEAQKYHMALKKLSADIDYEDLFQEGMVALYTASQKINENGADFISFAKAVVRNSLHRAILREANIIYIPEKKLADYINILKAMEEYNGDIDYKAIAEKLGLTKRAVLNTLNLVENAKNISSLNDPIKEEDSEEKIIFIKDENTDIERQITDSETKKEMDETVNALLKILSPNELKIIKYRFGFSNEPIKTLVEIGKIMGYSRETIRHIEAEAIEKMKKHIPKEKLKKLLCA